MRVPDANSWGLRICKKNSSVACIVACGGMPSRPGQQEKGPVNVKHPSHFPAILVRKIQAADSAPCWEREPAVTLWIQMCIPTLSATKLCSQLEIGPDPPPFYFLHKPLRLRSEYSPRFPIMLICKSAQCVIFIDGLITTFSRQAVLWKACASSRGSINGHDFSVGWGMAAKLQTTSALRHLESKLFHFYSWALFCAGH